MPHFKLHKTNNRDGITCIFIFGGFNRLLHLVEKKKKKRSLTQNTGFKDKTGRKNRKAAISPL